MEKHSFNPRKDKTKKMNKVVFPAPPPSKGAPKRRGRPSKWPGLLSTKKRHKIAKAGPYKNEDTAVATASYFNGQMRDRAPADYDRFRFRPRGRFVVCKRRKVRV